MTNPPLHTLPELQGNRFGKRHIALIAGVILATIHVFLFVMTAIGYYHTPVDDGQRVFWWLPFCLFDFPEGVIYFVTGGLISVRESISSPLVHELTDPAYWLFGPIGTLMWYFLPRLVLPRGCGGIWGKRILTQ